MTQTKSHDDRPLTAEELTPEGLYDLMMSFIEPELMNVNAEVVEETYKAEGETQEQKEARLVYYEDCYRRFEEAMDALEKDKLAPILEAKKSERLHKMRASEHEDKKEMEVLEEEFTDSDNV